MKIRHLLRASASAVVLSAVMSTAAFAQEEPAPADENTVDTIVVTVNKREQNLQDVPATVTALSGELMQDAGVKDIKDLQILTPGLTVTSTSNETVTTARIRGVGTVGDNPGLESSVGIVIDGVYRPRNGVSFGDLGELERIEVLKGPQGTLFGKNTSAGVINILTAEPEFEFGGNAELTAGEYGTIGGSASVTGPLFNDNLAGRIFFATRRVKDASYAPPDRDVYSVAREGGEPRLEASIDGPIGDYAVSPDGKRVVFAGYENPKSPRSFDQVDLFVADLPGGAARNLTTGFDNDVDGGIIGD